MTVTLVIPSTIDEQLVTALDSPEETAGVLLASVVEAPDGSVRLLARELHWVNEEAYQARHATGLQIRSTGYVPALGRAEDLGTIALWVHTHPGDSSSPRPSAHDEVVDYQLADLFRLRSGCPYYGAVIFSRSPSRLTFTGHIDHELGSTAQIDQLWIVGERVQIVRSFGSEDQTLPAILDRNVRALGKAVQQTLGQLSVGIVGLGGTGSAVAEQLVRLGVRRFLLIDPDCLSPSNLTRVYGSRPADVGKPKVNIAAAHLLAIAPDAIVQVIRGAITEEPVAHHLVDCDLVFGCTDDNAGRLVLSRFATYMLVPVIDCGVVISSDGSGEIAGIDGRVTVLTPGAACLVCRGRIDLRRAAAELMSDVEHTRRVAEGYAPALGAVEPAVVSFTTAVAAAAVSELIERLIGYGPVPRPSEVLLRLHEREISTNRASPTAGHYCDPTAGKLGVGVTDPFLEQVWPA